MFRFLQKRNLIKFSDIFFKFFTIKPYNAEKIWKEKFGKVRNSHFRYFGLKIVNYKFHL